MNRRILFAYAHLDDETIMSYGTIKKHIDDRDIVKLVCFCCGRSEYESRKFSRIDAFNNVMKSLDDKNFQFEIGNMIDLSIDPRKINAQASSIITGFQPHAVYTHDMCDFHIDHAIVGQQVLLAARSLVYSCPKEFYTSVGPQNMLGHGQPGNFQANTYVDISEYISKKEKALKQYVKCGELPHDKHDIRSIASTLDYNAMSGKIARYDYAEAFKLVFSFR